MKVKVFIEGFYNNGQLVPCYKNSGLTTDDTICDMVDVLLFSELGLVTPVVSLSGMLKTNGEVELSVPEGLFGNEFWLSVKHRNSIQVFSKLPVLITENTEYDFTTTDQAFSKVNEPYPMAEVEAGVFAMYSGDVNQDGVIDSEDYSLIENSMLIIPFGYLATDITGKGTCDSDAYSLIENQIPKIIFAVKPD